VVGLEVQVAAEEVLRTRGIVPDDVTQEQLLEALEAVS
jgi:hypothetical protein